MEDRQSTKFDLFATIALAIASILFIGVSVVKLTGSRARDGDVAVGIQNVEGEQLTVSVEDVPVLGTKSPGIVVIEFSDFECPFCARFERETFGQIKRAYVDTGQVSYVYKHLPLSENHSRALPSAKAAECAATQGRFWEMRSRLFTLKALSDGDLIDAASAVGIVKDRFLACWADPSSPRIERDLEDAARLGVASTPTFLVGLLRSADGQVHILRRVNGARPFATFEAALEGVKLKLTD